MFYAVKVAEGKGLGVFAIRDLKRGTRIMRERPLIHLPKGNMMYVSAEFAKLSGHEQALYLSLHCRPLGALDAARTSNLRARQGLRASAVALSIEEQVKIMAICETNAFEAGEGSVICSEASRIDHSCLPNVHHCWNDTIGQETVHAVKDIAPGEEILTTYVGVSGDSGERKKQLNRYGFTCDCPACDDSTTFGRASEKRCTRLFHLDQGLAMHSTLPVFSPFGNDRKALNAVLEYAELLRKEGVETMELTRRFVGLLYSSDEQEANRYSFREAASFSASIGNLRKACEWAEKALEMTACYAGTDYDGYKMDQETLQDFVIRHDRGRRTR